MANIDIGQLKGMRAHVKGQLTRNFNWVNSLEEGEDSVEIFISRLRQVEIAFDKYNQIQSSIEGLSSEDDSEDSDAVERKYHATVAILQKLIKKFSRPK